MSPASRGVRSQPWARVGSSLLSLLSRRHAASRRHAGTSKGFCITPWEDTHWVLTPFGSHMSEEEKQKLNHSGSFPKGVIPGFNTKTLRALRLDCCHKSEALRHLEIRLPPANVVLRWLAHCCYSLQPEKHWGQNVVNWVLPTLASAWRRVSTSHSQAHHACKG